MGISSGPLRFLDGESAALTIHGSCLLLSRDWVKGALWVGGGPVLPPTAAPDEIRAILEIPGVGEVSDRLVRRDDAGGSFRPTGRRATTEVLIR